MAREFAYQNLTDPPTSSLQPFSEQEIAVAASNLYRLLVMVIKEEPTATATATSSSRDSNNLNVTIDHGSASLIGRSDTMEDSLTVLPAFVTAPDTFDFFAVYDGHGGPAVAETCRDRMHVVVAEEAARSLPMTPQPEGEWWRMVIGRGFAKVDEEVHAISAAVAETEGTLGSTAVAAVVGLRLIVVANCGDSRAVLCRRGIAVPLSTDHKPDSLDERERIQAAGGYIVNWNGCRVMGILATSRSIGDYHLKPFVSPEPDIRVIDRTEDDEFMILASDGLWDVVSNDLACKVVRKHLYGRANKKFIEDANGSRAQLAATQLAKLAICSKSHDNVSVIIVQLKKIRTQVPNA